MHICYCKWINHLYNRIHLSGSFSFSAESFMVIGCCRTVVRWYIYSSRLFTFCTQDPVSCPPVHTNATFLKALVFFVLPLHLHAEDEARLWRTDIFPLSFFFCNQSRWQLGLVQVPLWFSSQAALEQACETWKSANMSRWLLLARLLARTQHLSLVSVSGAFLSTMID